MLFKEILEHRGTELICFFFFVSLCLCVPLNQRGRLAFRVLPAVGGPALPAALAVAAVDGRVRPRVEVRGRRPHGPARRRAGADVATGGEIGLPPADDCGTGARRRPCAVYVDAGRRAARRAGTEIASFASLR